MSVGAGDETGQEEPIVPQCYRLNWFKQTIGSESVEVLRIMKG